MAFSGHHVDAGLGEVFDPAGVIEIEVGENDVPHVAG